MKGCCFLVLLCISSLFVVSVNAQVNLQNGLVAYYPFNGNVNDLSGNNHNGTVVNAVSFSADRFGTANSATKFNGNGYIRVPDNGAFSSPKISLSLWFKTDSDDLQNLVGKRRYDHDGTPAGGSQYQFFINYSPYPGIGSNLVGNNTVCDNVNTSSYLNTANPICKERWYHAVITFDGSFHKIYINGVLKRNEPTAFNAFSVCNSELRFGTWWSLDPLLYKGLMDDVRWYNRAINENEILALYNNFEIPSSVDFTFKQDVCSPKLLEFTSTNTTANSYDWDFGDGTIAQVPGPSKSYSNFGVYTVKLNVTTSNGCLDRISKKVPILATFDNTSIIQRDTTICAGNNVQLNGSSAGLSFCWSPAQGLSDPNASQQQVNPSTSTTYYLTSQVAQSNLVVNGNFSQTNTGFSSDYTSAATNNTEAQFWVANDPFAWNANFNKCTEHTNGSGKMMMVNGSSVPGAKVWGQVVPVTPNTNYAFSVWIQSLAALNPASLKFSINGITLGDDINAGGTACEWKQFYTTWNSGNSSSASISIVNNNTIVDGNDFAIDDISFAGIIMKQDSVRITVAPAPLIRSISDTSICAGNSVKLNTTGGAVYKWEPVTGISNSNVASPVVTPDVTRNYIVEAYTTPGCVGRDTVKVTLLPKPLISLTNDTTICSGSLLQLNARGGDNYQWSPSTDLSSATGPDPVSKTQTNVTYHVKVDNANGCSNTDSVVVKVTSRPTVSTLQDTSACKGSPVILKTSVSGTANVRWSPATDLSSANVLNPVANPTVTTKYIITAGDGGCTSQDSLILNVLPPPVTSITNDTMLCAGSTLQLNVGGGVKYHWSPAQGLTANNINNPVVSPTSTTAYFVEVEGANGCTTRDSVNITVAALPIVSTLSNSAVCEGSATTLLTSSSAGVSYKWSPANGISDPTIASPVAKPSVNTLYIVTVTTPEKCEAKDSVTLSVLSAPNITSSPDTTICSGAALQLFATGGETYQWTPSYGLSDPNISNPTSGTDSSIIYQVSVSGSNGCAKTDSVYVGVKPKPVFSLTPLSAAMCANTTMSLKAAGGNVYTWLGANPVLSPNSAVTLVMPTASTTYSVRIHDSICNLSDTLSSSITLNPLPTVSIVKSNDIDCSFPSARLSATGGNSYSWFPTASLSGATLSNPVASPASTTSYVVTVTDAKGCSNTDSIRVEVKFTGSGGNYNLPTAFTPNGDGKNDCFGVKFWGAVTGLQFSVYNRWGERVFLTNDGSNCWDGTYKGVQQNSGAFVYVIKANTICGGEVTRKGTVVLIR